MTDSRRGFLRKLSASGFALQSPGAVAAAAGLDASEVQSQAATNALSGSETVCRVNVLTNHIGYLTRGSKKFLVESNVHSIKPEFHLRDLSIAGENRAFQGQLKEFQGDFGRYYVGDFSAHTRPGKYRLVVSREGLRASISSHVFTIADDYRDVVDKGVGYFAAQRCGPSTTGYHSPCHLDDGIRLANGQFQELVGGWHDANDLLKLSRNLLIGLTGLLRVAEKSPDNKLKARIFEEARWGNLFFLKIQNSEGAYCVNGFGGNDVGNKWTDNIPGTADDRPAVLDPGPPHMQHSFIAAQTHLATLYKAWDAPYTKVCFDAALRCFNWVKTREPQTYLDFGTGAEAGARLYLATGDRRYLDYALKMAEGYAGLQETGGGPQAVRGYFYQDASRSRTVLYHGIEPLAAIGFCEMIEALKGKMDVSRWEKALALHCDSYLLPMAGLNAFGIVPSQVNLKEPHPGSRSYRGTSYVYFEFPQRRPGFYQGNSTNMAGTGIVLCYARRILGSEKYEHQAQRMLDWILGLNPFDLSMMIGVGLKNPPMWLAPEFLPNPQVTDIPGAVVNGIAGDEQDRPDMQGGAWQTCEVWTPHVAQTMWLANELSRSNKG